MKNRTYTYIAAAFVQTLLLQTAAGAQESTPTAPAPAETQAPAAPDEATRSPDRNTAEDWLGFGANNHGTRFSPASQITPENVSRLEKVWEFHTGDLPHMSPNNGPIRYGFQNTPTKVGDTLYVCTPSQQVIALNAKTGEEKWRFDPKVDKNALANVTTATCRGVAYYEAPQPTAECQTRIIYGTIDSRLLAIDAQTGQTCSSFGENGAVDLNRGIGKTVPGYVSMTSPPTIVRGVVVTGHQVIDGQYRDAPSGVVRGWDAVTGQFKWAWDMGRPGVTSEPPEGETYTRGTPNVWAPTAGDEALGLIFLPLGNSAGDYFGGDRGGEEEKYNSAIVAVDVTTGLVRWAFQTVHHDIWDYDIGSQPSLIDFPTENGVVPAVFAPTKQGQLYVLDRATGKPLTEVVEKPVPQGAVEGDWTSPTQPYSVGMPSVDGADLTEKDAWGVSPLDQLYCRIEFMKARYQGQYTPPAVGQPTIFYPGFNGGVDWGSAAYDPQRGLMIVNNNNLPNMVRLLDLAEVEERGIAPVGEKPVRTTGGWYAQKGLKYGAVSYAWLSPLGVPCVRPPWGYIGAIDLKTRQWAWRKPLGTGQDSGPWGIKSRLPITMGTPNNGGSAVTAGGVTFIAAALDNVIRAFDTQTGELLWQDRLPAGGQAGPVSYEIDGRQYVVIAAGGHTSMRTDIGDSVVAYALPE